MVHRGGPLHGFLSWRRKKVGIVRDLFLIRGVFTSLCHNADKAEKISDDCMENEKSLLDTRPPTRLLFRQLHSLDRSKAHKVQMDNTSLRKSLQKPHPNEVRPPLSVKQSADQSVSGPHQTPDLQKPSDIQMYRRLTLGMRKASRYSFSLQSKSISHAA